MRKNKTLNNDSVKKFVESYKKEMDTDYIIVPVVCSFIILLFSLFFNTMFFNFSIFSLVIALIIFLPILIALIYILVKKLFNKKNDYLYFGIFVLHDSLCLLYLAFCMGNVAGINGGLFLLIGAILIIASVGAYIFLLREKLCGNNLHYKTKTASVSVPIIVTAIASGRVITKDLSFNAEFLLMGTLAIISSVLITVGAVRYIMQWYYRRFL